MRGLSKRHPGADDTGADDTGTDDTGADGTGADNTGTDDTCTGSGPGAGTGSGPGSWSGPGSGKIGRSARRAALPLPPRRRGPTPVRVTAALASTAALAVLAGCSTGGTGTRDEGPAHTDPVGHAAAPSPTPSETPAPAQKQIDPVALVMKDPKVSAVVKKGLRPCRTNSYPVDVSYGKLTGPSSMDVLVNVMTCNSIGVGSYVFRQEKGRWQNIFQDEEQPVYATIDRGDLVVTQKVYEQSDSVTYPTSEDVITYRWSTSAGRFTEQDRTHNEYSNAVGGDKTSAADN